MPTIKCDTAAITITSDGQTANLVVPAYTVDPDTLSTRIEQISRDYFAHWYSQETKRTSLADFALYCLSLAAKDPRFIEDGE